MDLDTAIASLQRVREADGRGSRGSRELKIVVHSPGGLGATPGVPVAAFNAGIDWDQGSILVTPALPLSALTPETVQAISESARRGQSWHTYESQRVLRDQMANERGRLATLRALLVEVSAAFTRDDELPDGLLPRISAALKETGDGH
jgi:hypothetical protein